MTTETSNHPPQRINVLAIDGGGIRGIIPAMVMAEIEAQTGRPIAHLFDLIAGSSTGGILALGLTKPLRPGSKEPAFSAAQMVDLYVQNGAEIFPQGISRKVAQFFGAKYPTKGLDRVLRQYFGGAHLRDTITRVLITSYDIEHRQAFFFKSTRAQNSDKPGSDFAMCDVARATAAAPTYFTPARLALAESEGYFALIDGSMIANNPAMCAYVEALRLFPGADICVVSLGAGIPVSGFDLNKASRWGVLQWAVPAINVAIDGPSNTVHYQLDTLLRKWNYYRLDVKLVNGPYLLDDASDRNIQRLQGLARVMIDECHEQIERACARLLVSKFYPLTTKAVADACGISSQQTAAILRELQPPTSLCRELILDHEREKWYSRDIVELVAAALQARSRTAN
jgi:uncharacterized protein